MFKVVNLGQTEASKNMPLGLVKMGQNGPDATGGYPGTARPPVPPPPPSSPWPKTEEEMEQEHKEFEDWYYNKAYPIPEVPPEAPQIVQWKREDCEEAKEAYRNWHKEDHSQEDPGLSLRKAKELSDAYQRCVEDLEVELWLLNRQQPQFGQIPNPFTPFEPPYPPVPTPGTTPDPQGPTSPTQEPKPTPTPGGGSIPFPEFGPAPFAQAEPVGTPVETQSAFRESLQTDCPIGQFPEYPGGPCRGGTPTGGLPGIPGGLTSASVAPMMPAGYGSFSMLGRPIKVQNLF